MINRYKIIVLLSALTPYIKTAATLEGSTPPKHGLRHITKVSDSYPNQKIIGRLLSPQGKEPVPGSIVTLYKCSTVKEVVDPCTQICDAVTDAEGHYGDSPCFSSLQPTDDSFYYKVCIRNPLGPLYDFTPGKNPGIQDVTPLADNADLACSDPILVPANTVQVVNGELGTSPTMAPTKKPTNKPKKSATKKPTVAPTKKPKKSATKKPTGAPTKKPSESPPSRVTGTTFNDSDGDGVKDPNEAVRPGQNVTLFDCDGNIVATVVSDANGNFVFPNVTPKTCYTVLVGKDPELAGGDCEFTADVDSKTGSSKEFILPLGGTQNIMAGVHCPNKKIVPCVSNDQPGFVMNNCP